MVTDWRCFHVYGSDTESSCLLNLRHTLTRKRKAVQRSVTEKFSVRFVAVKTKTSSLEVSRFTFVLLTIN